MPDSIPLIRAGVMDPIVLTAERMGIPTQKILRSVGLPTLSWGEENPHQAIPLKAGMDFLERTANREGLPLFGLQVIDSQPLTRIRSLPLGNQNCANLYQLLRWFVRQARLQSTVADYRLVEDGNLIWLLHCGRTSRNSPLQTDLFTISIMIQLVRMVMGPVWLPSIIHLSARPASAIDDSGMLHPCDIRFNQQHRGIAFSRELLIREANFKAESIVSDQDDAEALPDERLSQQLEALLPAYLATPGFNHGNLERITGMSFRTLQRKLKKEGVTYSSILERVRLQLSQTMLNDGDQKISDIARQLGYSNAPNFIRAFRSWTGVSPGEYRAYRETSRRA